MRYEIQESTIYVLRLGARARIDRVNDALIYSVRAFCFALEVSFGLSLLEASTTSVLHSLPVFKRSINVIGCIGDG